jgi:hypothetical protein
MNNSMKLPIEKSKGRWRKGKKRKESVFHNLPDEIDLTKSIKNIPFSSQDGQKQHFRTSKTGKVFSAGKGTHVELDSKKIKEMIDKDYLKYVDHFDLESMRDDLKKEIDVDYITSETRAHTETGQTRRDEEYEKKAEEIDDMKDVDALRDWFDLKEGTEELDDALNEATNNYLGE